jgi:guanosine-3',5'-bis(diphosphate) 3'-pyrophosphohydrolase
MPIPSTLSPPILMSDVCDLLATYLQPTQVKEVYRAFLFSAEAHQGQRRRSGEPYVCHPVAVTYLLGQMRMDTQTLCAALLHDVIEDTGITKQQLAEEFNETVAELVDGVSKLSSIHFETREQAQAASFRKMLLAMNRDIRVIIVKLADRLHNMRTLGAMKPQSRRRIARETLEIYAPIANRLGMNAMRVELEELSFAALYPLRYQVLASRMKKIQESLVETLHTIKNHLTQRLNEYQIKAQVLERDRHYHGIYYKMREYKRSASPDKRKSFAQVTNICALRIIVDTVDACYRTLGVVHGLYKPLCERFKDYIAIPKINGYQSLHTVLFSHHGLLIEVQIRTAEMHEFSEAGITAYGFYHLNENNQATSPPLNNYPQQRASEWLQGLLEMPKSSGDCFEFLEQVKTDLFPEEVYVFTPKGKIMQLPKGATAIDFAYAIHSDVGNQCIAAKVNNQYVSLATKLMSGQTVQIVTAARARPHPHWLDFAVTARARSYIRHFLKDMKSSEAVRLGKRLLDQELANYSLSVDKLSPAQQDLLLTTFKLESLESLLADIGLGNRMALIVAHSLAPTQVDSQSLVSSPGEGIKNPLFIKGSEGVLVNFARCCRPIPGDEIVGFVSTGRGIIIHQATCKHVAEYRQHQPEKILAVEWEKEVEGEFLVDVRVEVRDKRGVLANVANAISAMGSNIEHVSNESRDGLFSFLKFRISVKNRAHLAAIMRHLRRLEVVNRIQRWKKN